MKTINNKICLLGALLLMLAVSSCRHESDTLIPYDHDDSMAFDKASKSFAEQYKLFWNAMNQNYAMWDYEQECGLDWDAHYDEFLPQFEALDRQETVSDRDLYDLMCKMVAPLHDGHLFVQFKNLRTKQFIGVSPGTLRNETRPDYTFPADEPEVKKRLGNLVNVKPADLLDSYVGSTTLDVAFAHILPNGSTYKWIQGEIARLSSLANPTDLEERTLADYKALLDDINYAFTRRGDAAVLEAYNKLVVKYAYLNIPELKEVSSFFVESGVSVSYALLKGNIAYLYVSSFALTPYLDDSYFSSLVLTGRNYVLAKSVRTAWQMWFDKIQELHQAGTLGGVIIDVRGNTGGMLNDYQYVMGALLPSGGFSVCQLRYKRGTARLDYSPLMPQVMETYEGAHATINEPIVVLANCNSVSMAEMTARSCKLIPNATLIGKRTWGGLCALSGNKTFSYNYSGHIGINGTTPVYAYIPMTATFSMEGKQLEGIGIDPDIEVDLDEDLFYSNSGDTQLERALQYIRTGN